MSTSPDDPTLPSPTLAGAGPPATAVGGPGLLGPWRLLSPLGEGGMGVVYLAERADRTFERQVAIKLIRPGFDSAALHERFLHERQTQGALAHPGIARLLDAGSTDDGRPYFVMDYVDGVPIDRWCRDHAASLETRIGLFLHVCDAVQYAHGRLIVHRDIKPSNILVDGDGQARLLDFGIAKLLPVDAEAAAELTAASERVLTPQYAAPEQLLGEAVGIAADVYALGVLLYLLLADEPPYRLAGTTPAAMERLVCHDDPPPPSARATDRDTARKLRGDLDHIVMMAMRKAPERRYRTVDQFADDLRRHRGGLPVRARPDTRVYRSRKFIARHRLVLGAAVLIALTLAGGLIASLWQMRRAEEARAVAEDRYRGVRTLAADMLFQVDTAIATLPGSSQARRLLVGRTLEQLDKLATEPGAERALLLELAAGYEKIADVLGNPYEANLGDVDGALASAARALDLRQAAAADAMDDALALALAKSQLQLGALERRKHGAGVAVPDRYQAAVDLLAPRLADVAARSPLARGLVDAWNLLGDQQFARADYTAARASQERAMGIVDAALAATGPDDAPWRRSQAITRMKLAEAMWWEGQPLAEVLSLLRTAVASLDEELARTPADARLLRQSAMANASLAATLAYEVGVDEALPHSERAGELIAHLLGLDPHNAQVRRDMMRLRIQAAEMMEAAGHWDDADRSSSEALGLAAALRLERPTVTDLQHDWATAACRHASLRVTGRAAGQSTGGYTREATCNAVATCIRTLASTGDAQAAVVIAQNRLDGIREAWQGCGSPEESTPHALPNR